MNLSRGRSAVRFLALVGVAALSLQIWFVARIALMVVVDPQSTAFQRSEAWRLAISERPLAWQQRWVGQDAISTNLKRAVIASEDAGFTEHSGVEWDALEKAWEKNARAEARTIARISAVRVTRASIARACVSSAREPAAAARCRVPMRSSAARRRPGSWAALACSRCRSPRRRTAPRPH